MERAHNATALAAVAAIGTLLLPLNSTMVVVALPTIASDLGGDVASAAWLLTAYLIAMASLQPLGGRFGDRFGRRGVMLWALLYFGVVSALAPLAQDLLQLTLVRLNQAVALSLFGPNALALLRDEVPERGRGAQFGLVSGAAGFGAALGPPLGSALAAFDWRLLFLVNVPVVIGLGVLAWRVLPRRPPARDRSLDLVGGIWLTALLAAASLLLTSASETAINAFWVAAGVAVVAGTWLFTRYESTRRDPVLPARLFRSIAFSAATAGVALSNFAMYVPLLVIPLLLANEGSAASAGIVLGTFFVAQIAIAPLGGRLSDSIGRRATVLAGSLITALGLGLVAPRQPGDILGLVLPLIVAGAGHALIGPALRVAAVEAAPKRDAGLASGTFSTSRYFGGIVSAIVFTAIARGGTVEVAPVFLGVAAVSVAGALLALPLPGRPRASAELPAEAIAEAD